LSSFHTIKVIPQPGTKLTIRHVGGMESVASDYSTSTRLAYYRFCYWRVCFGRVYSLHSAYFAIHLRRMRVFRSAFSRGVRPLNSAWS